LVLITEMLEICIQTSYDQNVQLILKSYLPVVYGTYLKDRSCKILQKFLSFSKTTYNFQFRVENIIRKRVKHDIILIMFAQFRTFMNKKNPTTYQ
jgi:hypothetical protein